MDHSHHSDHQGHSTTATVDHEHGAHDQGNSHDTHDKHAGHSAAMFQRLFWGNLIIAIPLLVFSAQIQEWFGYSLNATLTHWLPPLLGIVIYLWGGKPFLVGGRDEARNRQPGMMLLITMAISVAFFASLATTFGLLDLDFWWELAALIVVMLLGHWQEMKAIGQARGALSALAELLPDVAEVISADGSISEVSAGSAVRWRSCVGSPWRTGAGGWHDRGRLCVSGRVDDYR